MTVQQQYARLNYNVGSAECVRRHHANILQLKGCSWEKSSYSVFNSLRKGNSNHYFIVIQDIKTKQKQGLEREQSRVETRRTLLYRAWLKPPSI